MHARILVAAVVAVLPSTFGQAQPAHPQELSSLDAVPQGLSVSDWCSIRAAYEANRHTVFTEEGGYRARNPGQRWVTRFEGRGFLVQPDAGGWTWGLELRRYGFAGEERAVESPIRTGAEGQTVAYQWDSTLHEWYLNDMRGLEHGYTVRERPTRDVCRVRGELGPLTLTLAVRGELRAKVHEDGRGVDFLDVGGAAVLTYAGLVVLDADGRRLPGGFEQVSDELRLAVDECGARYPLTIDPLAQQAYLKASNTDAGDMFGYAVAVSGNTVVVGAVREDSSATGVNGDQSNNSATDAGAAYVFVRSGASWSQQAYLKASNTGASDEFGFSVSLSGDTAVVGALFEDSNATGVNGNQGDNSASAAGAAYVFVRSGTSWSQQAYLKASNTESNDVFGHALSISGDTVVIGAHGENSNATGVNGNQSDNSASAAGAVYVFMRSGTSWSQQAYLKASNTGAGDYFGHSVAAEGDTLVVGATRETSNATGVNGNQSNNSVANAGATYVFVRNGTSWSQEAYLKASNTEAHDLFGFSVSVSGDTVAVAAYGEDSAATGVNGSQSNNGATDAGAVYVFVRNGTSWSQQAYLKASNSGTDDRFGVSVSASGDSLVVGAHMEDSKAMGVNGDQSDSSLMDSGAAYLFVRSGTTWSQQAYLKASNTGASDRFGISVSASGGTIVVGAYTENSNATGVNGNQGNNSATFAGATYVFDDGTPVIYCTGKVNSLGCVPAIHSSGAPSATAGSGFVIGCTNVRENKSGILFYGFAPSSTPFQGGFMCVLPPIKRTPGQSSAGTAPCNATYTIDFNAWIGSGFDPALVQGASVYSQWWMRDPPSPSATGLSNALSFQIGP